jgi:hypothetical protein
VTDHDLSDDALTPPGSAGAAAPDREPAWFTMVPLPPPTGLRAAGSGDIIAERSTPDGQLDIYFRPGPVGATGYQSEVVLRITRPLPVIVSVRYEADGRQHEILIPIAAAPFGPPVAEVYLRGLAPDMHWEISAPAQLTGRETWSAATVAASIQATPESGRDNWRAYCELSQRDMRQVITRALGS